MRNAQTIKLLHAWTDHLVPWGTICARCKEPKTRGNTWFRCPGAPQTTPAGTPNQAATSVSTDTK
jgi:hypothetical protein